MSLGFVASGSNPRYCPVLQAMFVVNCRSLAKEGSGFKATLEFFDSMLTDFSSTRKSDYFQQRSCPKLPRLLEVG